MPDSRERVLTRIYSLLAAASVVPLLIVILMLALFQFDTQRQQLLEELEEQAVEHNVLLGSIVKTVQDHVRTLAAWGEVYWTESNSAQAPPPAAAGARPIANGGLVIRGAGLATRPGAGAEARLAENLTRHMLLSHQALPYLRWSYYVSARADLVSVVPFAAGESFDGELRDAPPDAIIERFAHLPIMRRAIAEAAALDHGWTEAYFDPAGAGWVVAYAAPVAAGAQPIGVVGAAVLLDFLTGFLRAFDYPGGQLWLVDDQLQVLAASDGGNLAGSRLRQLEEVLPEGLRAIAPAQLLVPSRVFRDFGDAHVLAQGVGSTPWTLLYVISAAEVAGVILPRLVPYGIILAALILTLILAHAVRQRVIVRPALAFADYIKAESADHHPHQPRLPAFWQPLVKAVGGAFSAQRGSLAQIQDSDAMKSAIIASAFDAVIAIDEAGLVVEFNPSAEQMFGVSGTTARGQPLAELIVPAHLRERHQRGMQRYLASGRSVILGRRVEMEALRADGTLFPIEIAITEVRQAGRRLFTAYLRDITERRAMERALRESEQHFRTIAESHPVPVAIVRLEDGSILHASQAFADLFGMLLADIPGQDIADFYADLGQRARLLDELRQNGAVRGFEVDQRRPDGSVFPTALTSRVIEFQSAPAVVSAIIDLTEQKRQEAEIARQREALHQSEKLNALGSLLASVAHELNNPLSVVVGYATMMRDLATDAATRERAVRVQAAAERCARIVRTFLAMARQKPEAWGPVRIDQVVESALEVAGYGLRSADVEVTLDLAADLPPVRGDADQLTLVAMNLMVNAQHALQTRAPPRRLEITTRHGAGRVRIEVGDNGPGIPHEIARRIFDPFFTTKPQGVGTGIGLSVCHGIVSAHQGTIAVGPQPGGGTRFTVDLPAGDNGRAAPPPAEEPGEIRGRILVVEDESEIAQMMAEILRRDGHHILLANSGRQALSRLDGEPVDLILSDLRMPDLDGPGLHRQLAAQSPALARRMVFVTGDVLTPETDRFLDQAGLPVLEKPIDPYDLRLKVRAWLSALGRA